MSTKDQSGPAFPIPISLGESWQGMAPCDGMTLRDYFAAKALAAMLANPDKEGTKRGKAGLMFFPGYAYEWADAMLAVKARSA